MNWNGERVLVTGAGGFIGSHLVERLAAEGARVRAMVHYSALGGAGWLEDSSALGDIEIVAGDITDRDSVAAAVRDMRFVFHLAALINIPYSYVAPASYVRTNIEGTMHVLQAARELDTERLIVTSTSEVYGTARRLPITEEHPLQGQSPYSASKIGADKLAEAYHRSFGVPVVVMRPFNTFGPRQSARAVIPTIIAQCLSGRNTIRLGNLTPTRDLNYISNTVDGFLAAGEAPDAVGRVIHFGSGREISIGDLAQRIAKMTGRDVAVECEERRLRPEASEVDRLLADNSLARNLLGWQPKVGLEEGLERTIAWMREHLDLYGPDAFRI